MYASIYGILMNSLKVLAGHVLDLVYTKPLYLQR